MFTIPEIPSLHDTSLEQRIHNNLNNLTKPQGSLGRLEEFAFRYCRIKRNEHAELNSKRLFTFAADHGITVQGVCPFPASITKLMVENMKKGGAAVNVMCRNAGIENLVIDMGINADIAESPNCIICKVAKGTADFSRGPAMAVAQCSEALTAGFQLAEKSSVDILGIGEMGIGNSSSASALYSLLLLVDPLKTVGAGTGASGDLLAHKKTVIKDAVTFHQAQWDKSAFDALRRVGGFEIAGMTGMIIGAAANSIPVVVDGFIAGSAALVAMRMCRHIQDYLFFSHSSAESFHKNFLEHEKIRPMLDLDMRLGEGTGAVLGIQLIEHAMHLYHEMATFQDLGMA